ncbi:MAG: hypothetical protein HZC36_01425 [Armatimonadetes bacterium]|nr:hypothetical protein [Armatimonadota bacterium]
MRVLAVPHWSFGRDRALLRAFREALDSSGVDVHYCGSNLDHNRTTTAFSGPFEAVEGALLTLAELALPAINLQRHLGSYPRTGGLDQCRIVPLRESGSLPADADVEAAVASLGNKLSEGYSLPVFLFELSERSRERGEIGALAEGGFGGLLDRELRPDFGPTAAHHYLGATLLGRSSFQIELAITFRPDAKHLAEELVREMADARSMGDPRFQDVSGLACEASSMDSVQICLRLANPSNTPIDPIVEFFIERSFVHEMAMTHAELVGPIRPWDMEHATHLAIRREQIVEEDDS